MKDEKLDQASPEQLVITLPTMVRASSQIKAVSILVMVLSAVLLVLSVVVYKAGSFFILFFIAPLVALKFLLMGVLLFCEAKNSEKLEEIITLLKEQKNAAN